MPEAVQGGPPAKAKVSREIGAWRDPALVELDKNATVRGGFRSHFENSYPVDYPRWAMRRADHAVRALAFATASISADPRAASPVSGRQHVDVSALRRDKQAAVRDSGLVAQSRSVSAVRQRS